jgi:hypothetical protein
LAKPIVSPDSKRYRFYSASPSVADVNGPHCGQADKSTVSGDADDQTQGAGCDDEVITKEKPI